MQINASALFQQIGLYQQLTFQKPHRLITTLHIQVSESHAFPLEVREYDDPYQLALSFCAKHQLNQIAVDVVEKRIMKILAKEKNREGVGSISRGKGRGGAVRNGGIETVRKNKGSKSPTSMVGIAASPLYEKGMKALFKAEETRIKIKMEREAQEERGLTFKPKINEVSERIVEVRRIIGKNPEKVRKMKMRELEDELKQCTFKPAINKESQKIVEERFIRNEEENIERLYNDSDFRKKRDEKRVKENQRYSYHPTINQKSKVQIRDTFMERLEKERKNKQDRHVKNINANECYSFTPEIGRPPKIQRNAENLPIGQYLMSSQSHSKNHLRSRSEIKEEGGTVGFGEVCLVTKNSGVIYQNLVKQRIESLFEMLDGNNDGLISPQYIDIEQLSTNTLLLMQPFFKQMEQMNAVLDERGFTRAMIKLLEVAPQHLKGEFITQRWKKAEEEKFSFRPRLNSKSNQLAQNRSALDLYEEGIKSKKKKEAYTAVLQAKKEEEELDHCTFKPLLNSVSHVYFKKYLMREGDGVRSADRMGSSRNEEM